MEQSKTKRSQKGCVEGFPVVLMKGRTFYKCASIFTLFCFVVAIHTIRDLVEYNGPPSPGSLAKAPKALNATKRLYHAQQVHSGRKLLEDECPEEDVEADCSEVHNRDGKEEQCNFVNCAEDCENEEGLLEYNRFVYCTTGGRLVPLAMVVLVFWWLFCFVGLAVCADDFFCPSLVVISKTLHLSPNVAGVTFLAFGNGAPDVFSALAALDSGGDPGLGLGGLLGAGVFVTTVVCGTIAIITPFRAMERPFLRDAIFYLIGVYWTFFVLWKGYMYLYEAIGYIILWVVYVIIVIVSGAIFKRQRAAEQGKENKSIEMTAAKSVDGAALNLDPAPEVGSANPAYETDGSDKPKKLTRQTTLDQIMLDVDTKASNLEAIGEQEDESSPNPVQFTIENGVEPTKTEEEKEKEDGEEEEDEEDVPHWKAFLMAINPINVEEWPEMRWYARIFEVFKCPLVFVMKITCPVVNYEEDNWGWNKYLFTFQALISLAVFVILMNFGLSNMGGVFPVYALMLIIGAVLAVATFFTSTPDKKPIYIEAFGWLGFVVALGWIYIIANEVVSILETFGMVIRISTGILGLTLLAWGNSIGDWIADTVMARQGFARMGFAACFGGPFFNLCLGFGIPMIVSMVRESNRTRVLVMSGVQLILTCFLMGSLLASIIFLIVRKFRVNRPYGIFLVAFYLVFLVIALLVETNVFMSGWRPS